MPEAQNTKIILISKNNHEIFKFGNNSDGSFSSIDKAENFIKDRNIKTLQIGFFVLKNGKYVLSEKPIEIEKNTWMKILGF